MAFSFTNASKRVMPPWLQRTVGGALVTAIGAQVDGLRDRTVRAVAIRFPGLDFANLDTDERALGLTGRERRIYRGPSEDAQTYARRLSGWWDAHRTRGSTYAMLSQLHAFVQDWLSVPIEHVAEFGLRHSMAADGTVTRDQIAWTGDGSGGWAHAWLFFHLPDAVPLPSSYIVTSAGDFLVTSGGDFIVATETITPGSITADEEALFTLIPAAWRAGHVPYVTVVLLYGDAALVGYPPRLIGDNPPNTVTPTDTAIVLTAE